MFYITNDLLELFGISRCAFYSYVNKGIIPIQRTRPTYIIDEDTLLEVMHNEIKLRYRVQENNSEKAKVVMEKYCHKYPDYSRIYSTDDIATLLYISDSSARDQVRKHIPPYRQYILETEFLDFLKKNKKFVNVLRRRKQRIFSYELRRVDLLQKLGAKPCRT